jgi:hypothetical protein
MVFLRLEKFMHIQDGGVLPAQVVSSVKFPEKYQDFSFDGIPAPSL